MAETDPVATQTAAIAYSEVRPCGRTARGRDPRRAQTRVSVPCWPTLASSWNQISSGLPEAASGRLSLTQAAKFF